MCCVGMIAPLPGMVRCSSVRQPPELVALSAQTYRLPGRPQPECFPWW
jgi:hypothetical protein